MRNKIFIPLFIISATTIYLLLSGMKESVSFYITPSEFFENIEKYKGKNLKLGGFVSDLKSEGLNHIFTITDMKHSINVKYTGVPPDLFGKTKGAIVEGKWDEKEKIFIAKTIMAKHSEEYHPPGVSKELGKDEKE